MKFKKLFSLLIFGFTFMLSACELPFINFESNALAITKLPNTVSYAKGDTFSLEGLKIIETNNSTEVLDYTSSILPGSTLNTIGSQDVIISKQSYKSTSFRIDVKDLPRLEITHLPDKTTYKVGEYFSITGLEVKSSTGETIYDYTTSFRIGNAFKEAGEYEIKITKTDYIGTSFKVTVENEKQLVIRSMPYKTEYTVGEAFSSKGLVVDDNKGNFNLDYTLSIKDGDILKYAGTIGIDIIVSGYDNAQFNIKVASGGSGGAGEDKSINIYYVNDVHGSFIRNTSEYEAGMAYFSSYFKEKKADPSENAIILSGGDMFQGGVESNSTYGKIMVDAMNIAGFDAMALGNHELDWGEEKIIDNQKLMNFPLLSCNTFYKDRVTRPSWVEPYTIIERQDIKIGVVGFARANMGTSILTSIANDFYFPNPVSYIKQYASMLRLSYNCDLVLAVGHDEGFEGSSGSPTDFEAITQIDSSSGAKYVDGMFFAHDHTRKYGYYNDVPYCESGGNGRYLSHMKFDLTNNSGVYSVVDKSVESMSSTSSCRTEDKEVTALLEKYKDQIIDPDTVLRTLNRSYTQEEFCVVVCQALVWYVNTNPNLFNNVHVYMGTHNVAGIRARVYSGAFTYRNLVEVIPFDNSLCVQKCSSRHINYMLSSSYYKTYKELDTIPYVNGYTNAVTINYIAEYSNSNQYSYVEYKDQTAKNAVMEFMKSNTPITTNF